jgi:sec-independent protein translocase protein TatC
MKIKNKPTAHRREASKKAAAKPLAQPFIEHLHELRRRIYYIAVSVGIWSAAVYAVQQHVVNGLLRPAHGQSFIYTSPGGGIDFLFRVSIYNLLNFIQPLMSHASRRFIISISLVCSILAIIGIMFGYFIGLPAALHFLLHQFTTVQIKPLVTIQSYLSFVMAYMLGSALLFQLPVILVSINRIKPLKPKSLLHYERWAILAAFVLAGLMNPTPNLFSQLIVAGPFILMYQVSILLIALINRPGKSAQIRQMLEHDMQNQAVRQNQYSKSAPLFEPETELLKIEAKPKAAPISMNNTKQLTLAKPRDIRPARRIYIEPRKNPVVRGRFMDFVPQK